MSVVTISGDHAGKARALLDIAAREAEAGRKVLWFADSRRSLAEAHRRLVESIPAAVVKKVYRGHGDERITTAGGGEVVFICVRSHGGRGHTADTLIFGDTPVHPDALPCIAGRADGRVYASVLAPPA